MIPFTDREGTAVALVARRGTEMTIVESGRAPWIGRIIGLGVRAGYSLSGRVCLAVDLWNPSKLSAEKFLSDQ
jgi:hypothetical protein